MKARTPYRLRSVLAALQGVFYLVLGVWPLLHLASFEAVTGPKTDHWLVVTVGAVLTVEGAALLLGSRGVTPDVSIVVLASGTAAALALVDVVYVARGTIEQIYLLDAAAEFVFVTAWAATFRRTAN